MQNRQNPLNVKSKIVEEDGGGGLECVELGVRRGGPDWAGRMASNFL